MESQGIGGGLGWSQGKLASWRLEMKEPALSKIWEKEASHKRGSSKCKAPEEEQVCVMWNSKRLVWLECRKTRIALGEEYIR